MQFENVLIAFGLTLFAGLSTGIGSALAFFTKRTNTKMLSVALGFSAGVMIYISFMELLPNAKECLISRLGETGGDWVTVLAFFGGIASAAIIDRLVPSFENPHEMHSVEEMGSQESGRDYRKLYRMGIFSALVIAIHNFPEGFATFASAAKDLKLGVPIAVAVAIHNIPEGIAVSVPIFYATGNRRKAFAYSFLSGLAEPLGALIGYLIFSSLMNEVLFGAIFASVAGIMVFISLDALLPSSREYGEHHLSIYGLVSGMIVMALSLLIL